MMPVDTLDTLHAIDRQVLTDVVRQDQQSSTFELLDCTVKRLSDKGIMNPDGLFLFTGQGRDELGTRSWSVVLKILKKPDDEQDVSSIFYWQRELLLIQSGLMTLMPKSLAVPRFYAATEQVDGAWIWMEHIKEDGAQRWTLDQHQFAAYRVGQFSAECLRLNPLPEFPWLCTSHVRNWLAIASGFHSWDNPFVSKAFSSAVRERVDNLLYEQERFLNVLEQLPQVFSHFDFQRRNLFIRKNNDGLDELVVIDWALCGYGTLGGEVASLVGDNLIIFEVEPAAASELEAVSFPAYLKGLHEAGWTGNPEWVRLAYTARTALYYGAAAPALVCAWAESSEVLQLFGRAGDDLASGWAAMCEFALDRGDEARLLMDRLKF